jgi:hypothetical protein
LTSIFLREYESATNQCYDAIHKGWALDGKPTSGAMKLEFELDQRDMGLKAIPRAEQIYDFSLLDELARR